MSFQLYKMRLKCIIRNKESMFWSYMFPILLATCFFFAFNNLWSIEEFETMDIAYVSEEVDFDPLDEALKEAKMSKETPIFSVTYCNQEKASELLKNKDITAYIVGGNDPTLYVRKSGMNETIIKSFLDSYRRMSDTTQTILAKNPEALKEGLLEDVMQYSSFVVEKENGKKPDALLIYFYALIAFTCIFASNWGLEEVINIQADQSNRGARVSVSPIHKMKLFLCNMLAAFTAHCGSLALLFLHMFYALGINFGENMLFTFITCIIGSLVGLAIGATVGIYVKKSSGTKEAILTTVVLGGAFLSGMMIADIKYFIAEKFPLLSFINPVNLISDALYSLYYYDTYDRFYLNMGVLCVIAILLGVVSYIGIRRKTYASI